MEDVSGECTPPQTKRALFGTLHYGWIVVAVGVLVIFTCIGLARFAYTVLLPGMQEGLGLRYDKMGFIGTGNFIGYLAAILLCPLLLKRLSFRTAVSVGLSLIAVCMLGISFGRSFTMVFLLFALTGMGSGFANLPMMTLITNWFQREKRGRAAGLIVMGNGTGIIFVGILIPFLNRMYGADGWRHSWLVLGLISLAVAACAACFLRNHPGELGLMPVGRPMHAATDQVPFREGCGNGRLLVRIGFLYLIFGATFMIYGTFIVTTMVSDYGFSEAKAGLYWSWVGFFGLFSGVGFGTLSDFVGRNRSMALVFSLQTAAYLLAGLKFGSGTLLVSIILFGSTIFAIPAIMTATVGDYFGPTRAARAFSIATIFFAFGQITGPATAGLIAGAQGTFTSAYLLASLLTAIAAIIAIMLPPPQ